MRLFVRDALPFVVWVLVLSRLFSPPKLDKSLVALVCFMLPCFTIGWQHVLDRLWRAKANPRGGADPGPTDG